MNKLIRKLIIWAFRDKIIVLSKGKTVQDVELVLAKYPVYDYIQEEIAVRIAHEMVQSGIMKFSQEQDIARMSRTIIGKVYVLKLQ